MKIKIIKSFDEEPELQVKGERQNNIRKELLSFIETNGGNITDQVIKKAGNLAVNLDEYMDCDNLDECDTPYIEYTCDFLAIESNLIDKDGFRELSNIKSKYTFLQLIFDRTCGINSIYGLSTDALDEIMLRLNK